MHLIKIMLVLLMLASQMSCVSNKAELWQWENVEVKGVPTARHEAGLVALDNKIYLLGGRRINPTDVLDTTTNTWKAKSKTPIELHHFQPVAFEGKIYIVGALTGRYPNEKPVDKVIVYDPKTDQYEYTHSIPKHRQRGGAGTVVYNNKIYIVGGIINGHMDGYKSWFDEYDPRTGSWIPLKDAPNARDHFQAVVSNNKLYTFAGRTTSNRTGDVMNLTVKHGNVYNFDTLKWEQTTTDLAIPTMRAGNSAFTWNNQVIIGGGESGEQKVAHNEVEAFDVDTQSWSTWPSLNRGRHGSGFVTVNGYVYIISGSGNRGGGPELQSIERLKLPRLTQTAPIHLSSISMPVYSQWHTITLPFEGPTVNETDSNNPFLNYRLTVDFFHKGKSYKVRGFYAADGDSANSSAQSGNVWQVRFAPDLQGEWSYKATLSAGKNIALSDENNSGTLIPLVNDTGSFKVLRSDKHGVDFRSSGRLGVENTFFKFDSTPQTPNKYWMKGGTNSPENLLGYVGFDDTYRIKAEAREGEAKPTDELHQFAAHLKDWNPGDPTWKNGQGKSIVGAINYLAEMEMNSAYFLTLNILGDGKDVWPYHAPDDFTRFDVSKLDQWEVLFQHMQAKGILLHIVLQETENERMLDDGDTGPLRQLYFRELIARFGHHLGLIWNLGEENGPASFSPHAQNDEQRRAMIHFLKTNDPYQHPVLLHTHSHDPARSKILEQIIGLKTLDGLSLQADKREGVPKLIRDLKAQSKASGKEWLITMDEIGRWDIAVKTDELDPLHYSLQRFALWGSLMSGAAGVEWYFGAKIPHNDLTSEDWRQRHNLWGITRHATSFFQHHIPFGDMTPCQSLLVKTIGYCLAKTDNVYSVYIVAGSSNQLDLREANGPYTVKWYNPRNGQFQEGSIKQLIAGSTVKLGTPLKEINEDWVVLLTKF